VFEGCGMVLDPEDTPYLEIVCVKDPRNEVSMMETRDGDGKREEGDIKSKGDHEQISVEKQNSLITLAWSKPTHGDNHIQVHMQNTQALFCVKSLQTVHLYIERFDFYRK